MTRTPREMVSGYIDRMIAKAKGSWDTNGGTQYYKWEELKQEWDNKSNEIAEQKQLEESYKLAMEYIKNAGLSGDFSTWKRQRKGDDGKWGR